MENTCRVYKDREVLVISLCLSPLALLSHVQPWGISLCDSPVDELSLRGVCVSITVSLFNDGKLETKHRMMKWNFTVKKHTSKMPIKLKLAIYMTSLKL